MKTRKEWKEGRRLYFATWVLLIFLWGVLGTIMYILAREFYYIVGLALAYR